MDIPQSERERFEAWQKGLGNSLHLTKLSTGGYRDNVMGLQWAAWQAALQPTASDREIADAIYWENVTSCCASNAPLPHARIAALLATRTAPAGYVVVPEAEMIERVAEAIADSDVEPRPNNPTKVRDWLTGNDLRRAARAAMLAARPPLPAAPKAAP